MQILIVAVTCLTLVSVKAHHQHFTQEDKAKLYKHHQECKAQTGVDDKLIKESCTAKEIEDPKLREYLFCFNKKCGFQNESGEFQKDVIRTKLEKYSHDKERINKILAECTVQKETPVASAVAYFLCHRENSPDFKNYYFYVANVTAEQTRQLKEHQEICLKETELKPEVLAEIRDGKLPDSEKFKKFALCVSKRIGSQNNDGKINETITKEKLTLVLKNEEKVDNVMKKCVKEEKNPEETAFQMMKCLYDKLYFNFNCSEITQEEIDKARKYNEICKPISGILPEELAEAKKGVILQTETFKKHIFCIYKECGLVDDKGIFNKEKFFEGYGKHAGKEKAEEVYEKCKFENDKPENNAFKIFNCFIENISKKVNFFTYV